MRQISDLPDNNDEYWGDAEKHILRPKKIDICETHSRTNWMNHSGYQDNHDGTISCKYCSWGAKVPGHLKVQSERLVDMRTFQG